mmetsp:Transcript_34463/g.104008  ORF Transcript_34463/g.104008 Transcript_34463/m.104008 type:complete len:335 (+) Transcript_34463:190-1194(+)
MANKRLTVAELLVERFASSVNDGPARRWDVFGVHSAINGALSRQGHQRARKCVVTDLQRVIFAPPSPLPPVQRPGGPIPRHRSDVSVVQHEKLIGPPPQVEFQLLSVGDGALDVASQLARDALHSVHADDLVVQTNGVVGMFFIPGRDQTLARAADDQHHGLVLELLLLEVERPAIGLRSVYGHGHPSILQHRQTTRGEQRPLASPPLDHEDDDRLHIELKLGALGELCDYQATNGMPQQGETSSLHGVLEAFERVVRELGYAAEQGLLLPVAVPRVLVHRDLHLRGRVGLQQEPILLIRVGHPVRAEQPHLRRRLPPLAAGDGLAHMVRDLLQ